MNNKLYLGLIALATMLWSCGNNTESTDVAATERAYEVYTIQPEALSGSVSLPGELHPFESVNILANATGFVKSVNVDRGSVVKRGQVLAQLEAPELLADMAAARARVQSAEGEQRQAAVQLETSLDRYERIQRTSDTPGAVSARDLLQIRNRMKEDSATYMAAVSNLEAAKSTLEANQQMTGYLTVKAFFDGVITERNVHTGTYISSQGGANRDPLFRLEMNQKLRLTIPLPETYTGLRLEEDSLTFTVTTNPGKTYKGMISRQSGSLQNRTRTEMIEADIPNEGLELKAGSFAQVNLSYQKTGVIMVPNSAILTTMEDRFVVKVVNGQAQRIPVRRGLVSGPKTEIFGDIVAGDQILAAPSETIRTGDAIRVEGN